MSTNLSIVTPNAEGVNHLELPCPFMLFVPSEGRDTSKMYGTQNFWDGTLGHLLALCRHGSKGLTKNTCSGWAQGTYQLRHRKFEYLESSVACVVLDVDNELNKVRVPDKDLVTFDSMLACLQGREAILYTSFRSCPEWPKFRVILPLIRQVDRQEYRDMWGFITQSLGLDDKKADPQAKDITRFWYLSNPAVCKEFRVEHLAGKLWEVDEALTPIKAARVEKEAREREAQRLTAVTLLSDTSDRAKLVRRAAKYANKMEVAIQGSCGATRTFVACCTVARGFDLSVDEALNALAFWNANCKPPWDEADLRLKIEDALKNGKRPVRGALLNKVRREGQKQERVQLTDLQAEALGMALDKE